LDEGSLGDRNRTRGVGELGLLVPDQAGAPVGPIVARIADKDAVEVLRKTLRHHQGLAAAVGASEEVGPHRVVAIECLDGGQRGGLSLDKRAVAIIDKFLRVSDWYKSSMTPVFT
jgi:hypothetical protein